LVGCDIARPKNSRSGEQPCGEEIVRPVLKRSGCETFIAVRLYRFLEVVRHGRGFACSEVFGGRKSGI